MRVTLAALAAALAAVPAFAAPAETEPIMRDCGTRAIGDLGRDWRSRAVIAGPLAFVGMRSGFGPYGAAPAGRAWPLKVLTVVEPRAIVTVTIAPRSRPYAAVAYRLPAIAAGTVPLSGASHSVRYEACATPNPGVAVWNRGTQFPGYFLVAGPRCVAVEVRVEGATTVLRRTLRFGMPRCAP